MGIVVRLSLIALLCACGTPAEREKSVVESGKALFKRNGCAVCHGADGRGDGQVASALKPPPRDFRDLKAYKKGRSVKEIARTIERGVPGSTMPGYPHVSAEDRREIAIYIRSLQQQNADGE